MNHPDAAAFCERANGLFLSADLNGADSVLSDADLALKDAPSRVRACVALVRAQVRDNLGRSQESIDEIETLLKELRRGDKPLRIALRLQQGHSNCVLGRLRRAKPIIDRAYRAARESGDNLLLANASLRKSMLHFRFRDSNLSLQYAHECIRIAAEEGDKVLELYGKLLEAKNKTQAAADPSAALEQLQNVLPEAQALGYKLIVAKIQAEIATCLCELDRLDDSLSQLDEAETVLAACRPALHVVAASKGNVWLRKGEHARAVTLYQMAADIADSVGDQYAKARWIKNQAVSQRECGDCNSAAELARAASELLITAGDRQGAARCSAFIKAALKAAK